MVTASAVTTAPAIADTDTLCFDRDRLVTALAGGFQQTPQALGVTDDGGVIELFTSADGATWTMALTKPSGQGCIMTSGENWVAKPKADRGAPS